MKKDLNIFQKSKVMQSNKKIEDVEKNHSKLHTVILDKSRLRKFPQIKEKGSRISNISTSNELSKNNDVRKVNF